MAGRLVGLSRGGARGAGPGDGDVRPPRRPVSPGRRWAPATAQSGEPRRAVPGGVAGLALRSRRPHRHRGHHRQRGGLEAPGPGRPRSSRHRRVLGQRGRTGRRRRRGRRRERVRGRFHRVGLRGSSPRSWRDPGEPRRGRGHRGQRPLRLRRTRDAGGRLRERPHRKRSRNRRGRPSGPDHGAPVRMEGHDLDPARGLDLHDLLRARSPLRGGERRPGRQLLLG